MSSADDPIPPVDADVHEAVDDVSPRRTGARVFIVVAVLAQLVIPLTYYLRDDPYDERFAWRMFSGVRLQECEGSVIESRGTQEEAVNPYEVLPAGWVTGLERNRRPVVDRYLALRCEEEGVTNVRFENRCHEVDGEELPVVQVARDCSSGELTR